MSTALDLSPISRTVTWESTDCPLCGSHRRSLLLAAPDYDAPPPQPSFTIVRCRECDLCYTNPRPGPAHIGRYYYQEYSPHRVQPVLPKRRSFLHRCWRQITPKRPPNWERGEIAPLGRCRLLDFGCGAGGFLQLMHQRGWDVLGVDLSESVVERVVDELKLPALVGTLPHPQLFPDSFDLVTLWHSLEHVHRPLEVLKEVYSLLSPGGKVLVAVPNIDSAPFHWFGPAWFGLDLPRHLTHFTPATLKKMLACASFQFDAMQMTRHSLWLRQSARRAAGRGKVPLPLKWLKHRFPSSFVSRCYRLAGRSDSFIIMAQKPQIST
jgi:2-polyprenyl-3-methyl-5-hydroxy-6-metoxy-1,4-benzoquinol methylase